MNADAAADTKEQCRARVNTELGLHAQTATMGGILIMRILISAIACLIAVPALALPSLSHLPVERDVCSIQIPPARYDRPAKAPKIGIDGPHYVGPAQVARECKNSGFEDAVGCTTSITLGKTVVGYRVLIASKPPRGTDSRCTPAKWRASILRHERAHLAGWAADHPQ